MTGLPMPTDYYVRRTRTQQLAEDMHWYALAYATEKFWLPNEERITLLQRCSMLADALAGPKWDEGLAVVGTLSRACGVFMCELCEKDTCECVDCHFPDGSEPDELEAA